MSLACGLAKTPLAFADPPSKTPSLSEIRDVRDGVEAQHRQRLKDIDNGLQINAYSSDEALMMRMKEEREYKTRLQVLEREANTTFNAMEAAEKRTKANNAPERSIGSNPNLPRFQSQSVITYPQGPDAPPAQDKPQKEGDQRNVGFGTRELEF